MTHELVLRRRALEELQAAVTHYAGVGHDRPFLDALDALLAAISALPHRFPEVHGSIRRGLVRRYPYAVFFRARSAERRVVVLSVLPQRIDPASWPAR